MESPHVQCQYLETWTIVRYGGGKHARILRQPARLLVELLEDRLTPSGGVHAPLTADNTVTMLEDTVRMFELSDFAFSDPNDTPADNFIGIRIASLPTAGLLLNNTFPVYVGQTISESDISAGVFEFIPDEDENGMAYAAFDFEVQDDGNSNITSAAKTMTINVTAVNDAPSFEAYDPDEVYEFRDPESLSAWASFSPGGGSDEASQTATYFVTNVSNTSLFATLPTVSPDGTLSYTLASYKSGESTFDLRVEDSAGGVSATAQIRIRAFRVLAPFTVNTTADTIDNNVGDGRALDASGNTSLRAALMEAGAAAIATSGLDVAIAFDLPANSTISFGATLGALPDLFGSITMSGPGYDQLTIRRSFAAGTGNFRIFTIAPSATVTISDISITNGNAAGVGDGGSGGGIANFGTLSLSGVTMYGNTANGNGGALFSPGANLTVQSCNLYLNEAGIAGGGIYNEGQALIETTTIASNTGWNGGGIYNKVGGQLTINSGSEIYSNNAIGFGAANAGRGGGIANWGTLTMSDVYLGWNTSVQEGGGLFSNGDATLTNVTIEYNQATSGTRGKGAGIYLRSGTLTLVSGCTISGNTASAPNGGNGICRASGGAATLILNPDDNPNITDDIRVDFDWV
jgi:hypothetical protein